ncbi:unnamed protein product [Urochloa humidicola]
MRKGQEWRTTVPRARGTSNGGSDEVPEAGHRSRSIMTDEDGSFLAGGDGPASDVPRDCASGSEYLIQEQSYAHGALLP